MFTRAIVKMPASSLSAGLTSAKLGSPDLDLALQQHQNYVAALAECGLQITQLPGDDDFPDSTFVEDAALLTSHCAIITRPGATSRRGETAAVREAVLAEYPTVHTIEAPATLEAGDVMMVGTHFYVGLSERTSMEGVQQLTKFLEPNGLTVSVVEMQEMLHLKTGLSYLENNVLLAAGEFLSSPVFAGFDVIPVPPEEEYAANSVWINGTVLVPAGNPQTQDAIERAGYQTIAIDTSEFRKLDGGLSCLSLRF